MTRNIWFWIFGAAWCACAVLAGLSLAWAYAMHRAHDGDQYRFGAYALAFGSAAQVAGVACLIFGLS